MDWVPFSKVISDQTSGNLKVKKRDYLEKGLIPVIDQGKNQIGGYTDNPDHKCKVPLPCILFGDHTKTIKYVDFPYAIGADGVKVLKTTQDVNAKFIYYFLKSVKFPANTGYSRHFKYLKRIEIPTPPLEKQKRIAAILDKAVAIRRKREEAIELADGLLKSVFLDMFGDPVTNPKRWAFERINLLIDSIETGLNVNGENRIREEDECGVLKISAVTSGIFIPNEHKVVLAQNVKRKVSPRKGDLLFSRANTRELVAATCIVEKDEPNLFLPDKLWRINTKENKLKKEYLKYLLSHIQFRTELTKQATGTSGSMLNISQKKFMNVHIPLPPIELQKKFSAIFWTYSEKANKFKEMKENSEHLFLSLSQRAFRGDL